jgi:hypothetical protein
VGRLGVGLERLVVALQSLEALQGGAVETLGRLVGLELLLRVGLELLRGVRVALEAIVRRGAG